MSVSTVTQERCVACNGPWVSNPGDRCDRCASAAASIEPDAAARAATAATRRPDVQATLDGLDDRLVELVETGQFSDMIASATSVACRYSMFNRMMLLAQRDGASMVLPYSVWQQMGRHVLKGETALRVLAPRLRKVENAETGEDEHRVVGFTAVPVFDISQTEGADVPLPGGTAVRAGDQFDADAARTELVAAGKRLNVEVVHRPLTGTSANGWFEPDETGATGGRIVIDSLQPEAQQISTLCHELGHAADPGLSKVSDMTMRDRGDAEAVAETVAHVLAKRHGVDTEDRSAKYILGWAEGDPSKVRAIADRVCAAIDKIAPTDRDMFAAEYDAAKAAKDSKPRKPRGRRAGGRR